MRVKLKTQEKSNQLRKHINFNINLLREDTQKLLITEDNEGRKAIERIAKDMTTARTTTRAENNTIWTRLGEIIHTQQTTNFPPGTRTSKGEKGQTQQEIAQEKDLIDAKIRSRGKLKNHPETRETTRKRSIE